MVIISVEIVGMIPKYDLDTIKQLVRSDSWGYLNERRIFQTLDNLEWGDDEVVSVICALSAALVPDGDFKKTVPACSVTCLPGCNTVDADMYRIHWDEEACTRRPDFVRGVTVELSLKLAIVDTGDGKLTGLVTLHT
jgi:hypothetical protein